ncbi:MAG: ral nucleoside transport system permease protein [Clostridiales bacterium]|nr:ral nucleoside transport system permease protein [Clostridiales bacterium]
MNAGMMIALFLASAIRMSIPLLLGTVGESLTERSGHLNLGVEGLMMMGAATGYVVAYRTDSIILAIFAGMAGAGLGSLIYAFLTISMKTRQDVTGLALTIFGTGFANTMGKALAGTTTSEKIRAFTKGQPFKPDLTAVSEVPVLGPALEYISAALLQHNLFVYLSFAIAVFAYWYLFHTRPGLHVRSTGENPAAADASGIRVTSLRYLHVIVGGMFCGLGGFYISVVNVGTWLDDIIAGRGWIVVALVIFIRWHPLKAIAGSLLFGALEIVGFRMQQIPAIGSLPIFSQYAIDLYPYLMTIIVLVITYARKKAWQGPASLGQPYFREDR